MAASTPFRTGYMCLLLPSRGGDEEIKHTHPRNGHQHASRDCRCRSGRNRIGVCTGHRRLRKVASRSPQHSKMFGQPASSHTVCRSSRSTRAARARVLRSQLHPLLDPRRLGPDGGLGVADLQPEQPAAFACRRSSPRTVRPKPHRCQGPKSPTPGLPRWAVVATHCNLIWCDSSPTTSQT